MGELVKTHDKEDAEEAINKVYHLIAAYGRKVRERRGDRKQIKTPEPKIIPTSIPRSSYFTVYQAAQICHAMSKQIRAWIRKGELDAFDLPGLGLIIETEKLNEFISQRNS